MHRLSSILRWCLVAILLPIAVPVAKQFIDSRIEQKGFYAPADQAAGWLEHLIAMVAQAPGVVPAAIFLAGLTIGAWLDWVLRRFDGSRATRREKIGGDFRELALIVERRLQEGIPWPQCIDDLMPRITSTLLKAEKIGIWTPGSDIYQHPNGFNLLLGYLRMVGALLADGHFDEAKSAALGAEADLQASR